ncbi:MAG TPA: translation initiation factor IF-3 C-terminal domain-containing protein, partial [Sedimentisphaerales bacterium]|nr:translation initiation factor IF-3 C-terminal domain-containing protein [Sedimentisphaerales bacterium]
HAREFLEKGHRVQLSLMFRGRQMLHKDQGYELLNEIMNNLEDVAKVERPSALTGRRMTLLLVPK